MLGLRARVLPAWLPCRVGSLFLHMPSQDPSLLVPCAGESAGEGLVGSTRRELAQQASGALCLSCVSPRSDSGTRVASARLEG